MEFGDFFIHFIECAEKYLFQPKASRNLNKKEHVSAEKLQSLFELIIRTSSANNDPFKEDVSCRIDNYSLYEHINMIKIHEPETFDRGFQDKTYVQTDSRYLDYFTLDFKCEFPLNLIIN